MVVRLWSRCCRGFDFVRSGYHGTSARTARNRRAKFDCRRNTTGAARGRAIDISQQVRSRRRDERRLQHSRRRIAFCSRLRTTGAARSLQHTTNLAVAQSGNGRIPPRLLSQRGSRAHPSFGSMKAPIPARAHARNRFDCFSSKSTSKKNRIKNKL